MSKKDSHLETVDLCWDDLRHLESLDRLGSANAASRELGVAPSTIYRRIAALEQAMGVVCYSQRDGGVTGVGRNLVELARKTRTSLSRIRQHAVEDQSSVRGRIKLTTIDGFAPLLAEPLARLSRLHPELEILLDVSPVGSSVRKGEADIALTSVDKPPRQLVGRKLFTARCGVYGTAEHAENPDAAPWVVLGPPLNASTLGRWEREQTKGSHIAVATTSRLTFNRLLLAGTGIGAVPHLLAAEHPELVEVTKYRAAAKSATIPVWLLTHPELRNSAAVRAVLEVVGDGLVALYRGTSRP